MRACLEGRGPRRSGRPGRSSNQVARCASGLAVAETSGPSPNRCSRPGPLGCRRQLPRICHWSAISPVGEVDRLRPASSASPQKAWWTARWASGPERRRLTEPPWRRRADLRQAATEIRRVSDGTARTPHPTPQYGNAYIGLTVNCRLQSATASRVPQLTLGEQRRGGNAPYRRW